LAALPPQVVALISSFPDVVNEQAVLPPVQHSVQHRIETTGQPVTARFRRLAPAKLKAAK